MTTPNYDEKPWIKMPVSELMTPKAGKMCKAPMYWAVTPDDCVLFFKTYNSPQCNTIKELIEHVRPNMEIRFIETAFVPHNCSDFVT
jgi:hypothetical protein